MLATLDSVSAQALSDAKIKFPKICADGTCIGVRGAPFQAILPNQVDTAMEFLSQLTSTRTARTGSYQLKHVGEDWGKRQGLSRYVSNGAMIVAALALELPVEAAGKPWELFNPNCLIGVSAISVRRVIAANDYARREKQSGGVIGAGNPIGDLLCQSDAIRD
jgi:hypothetical protein